MFGKRKSKGTPGTFCPLAGSGIFGQCGAGCAWRVGDRCAMAVLASQAARQGDELYAMAEIMLGNKGSVATSSEDGAERPAAAYPAPPAGGDGRTAKGVEPTQEAEKGGGEE